MYRAIYLDTNAIISAGRGLDADWMERAISFASWAGTTLIIPQLVFDEWLFELKKTCRESVEIIKSKLAQIRYLSGIEVEGVVPQPDEVLSKIDATMRAKLDHSGIVIIPTIEMPLALLIDRAVSKTEPFEAGDRGFRDTLIVATICADATANREDGRSLVVTADRAFAAGVRSGMLESDVDICKPGEIVKRLDAAQTEAIRLFRDRERALGAEFLNRHKEMIFNYVRSLEVSSFILKMGDPDLRNETIKRISAVRPIRVLPPLLPFLVSDADEGQSEEFFFDVELEIDLVTESYTGSTIFNEVFSFAKPGEPINRYPNEPTYVQSEKTIIFKQHVKAKLEATGDPQSPFRNLQILDRFEGGGLLGLMNSPD